MAITLGVAVLAGAVGYFRGKQFTARGEIEIQPGSAADLKQSISSVLTSGGSLDVTIESDTRILLSDKLLLSVARTLKLQDNPDFLNGKTSLKLGTIQGKVVPILHGDLDNSYVRYVVLNILRKGLQVTRVPRTQMIAISFVSKSPDLSASVVNTLINEFIKNNFVSHYSNTQQVTNWLTNQIDDLRSVVQASQDRMVDLQKKLGISALDPQHSLIVQEITDLEKSAAEATQQRVIVEARYQVLESLPKDQILDSPTPLGNEAGQSLLSILRSQRSTNIAELAKLQPVYGPNYPQVKQLSAQIQSLNAEIESQEARVINQARDATGIARNAESQAKKALDTRVRELYGQRDDLVQYELLSQEYESNRHMYESILARLREAAVDAGLDSADVSVVDLAEVPILPSSMPLRSHVLLGLLLGFTAGLMLIIVLERLDSRMRDSKQIQSLLGLPALAIIPETNWKTGKSADQGRSAGPELLWDVRSSFSESIRVLRTSVQLSSVAKQSRVIAISSCQPGEGKSTVSTNLAAALAQGGKRVILVDTDMRRPSVYWRLGLTVKNGLSEYLTGMGELDSLIQTHQELKTLDLMPSGFSPPLPADLLSSERMRELVVELRRRYEYVILDTPPALSVTDPLIVATQADGMVLVIRQGFCTRAMLSRAAEIFRDVEVKVYGFVLNGVDSNLPEYYGYLGYYSYEYKN